MLVLRERDIVSILLTLSDEDLHRFHDDLSQSFIDAATQDVPGSAAVIHMPARTHIISSSKITTLIMPSSDEANTAIKTVVLPPEKPSKGAITLFSADGDLLALLNAAETTSFRTALTTMTMLSRTQWSLSAELQPSPQSGNYNLVIFGSGRQAEWHLRLALRFCSIKSVTIVNRTRARLEKFARDVFEDLRKTHPGVSFEVISQEGRDDYESRLHQTMSTTDIIFCLTPSTKPLFPSSYLTQQNGAAKSRFISLIGSYKPHMQEVDKATLFSAADKRVIVDSAEACLEEAGELIRANADRASLIEAGHFCMRISKDGIAPVPPGTNVVFKCVGTALMDLVVSRTLVGISRDRHKGHNIPDF
ncbi:hypothetical protein H2198_005687 [Neophaeococcomyces mojaviensis]|uniref:Uncharacterized protein n=1 Tax=Neophaeococcomyces mojaviensis TaxID=3383035 RepID=A0ACC3A553_9EURO|nr:hypothetical protein H2198_005687 [Knufia sp. JES_112]